jgi:nucleoside-diphosphate-sugar epimerase
MRVLVTGGAGYVGSLLTPMLLEAGYQVRVVDNLRFGGGGLLGVWAHPAFEFQLGDVRDRQAVGTAVNDVDMVVHLAALVGDPACDRDQNLTREVNLDASLQLIETSACAGVERFIFASTCSNYGKMCDADGYVDESSQLRPLSLYAETKVAVERALLEGAGGDAMCASSLRLATVFGVSPRMRFDLTVNEFTAEMVVRRRLEVFGEQFWRPYVHVRDAARAMLLAVQAPAEIVDRRVFNVGATEENYQKRQLVELIRVHIPDATVQYVHKAEDPRDYRVSFARIREQLGFQVTRRVPDGIAEIVQLVRDGIIDDVNDQRYHN